MSKIDISSLLVYRIVHINNLEHILKNGIYVRNHPSFDPNYVNIGNSDIINVRETFPVNIDNYGYIGDYVPFYFGRQSIMLYNILTEQNGLTKHHPSNIIYLCCRISDLVDKCSRFFFTDGQANKKFTEHFINIDDLGKVDWDTINSSDFRKREDDPDRLRRYQAEFLVHEHVAIECINKIVVYDRPSKEKIERLLTKNNLTIPVRIANKHFYYFYF